jgi:hypothetical protein
MKSISTYTDDDAKRTILNALRLIAIAAAVGIPLLWWKLGWESAALLAIGALISASGLYEWLRLMAALMVRMDVAPVDPEAEPVKVKPLAPILIGFFLRLGLAVVLLYGSLKFLHGSVYALIAGLALGVASLSIEGLRLVKSWTV